MAKLTSSEYRELAACYGRDAIRYTSGQDETELWGLTIRLYNHAMNAKNFARVAARFAIKAIESDGNGGDNHPR